MRADSEKKLLVGYRQMVNDIEILRAALKSAHHALLNYELMPVAALDQVRHNAERALEKAKGIQ